METLLRQLSPISAIIAASILNIINYVVKIFVPEVLLQDVGILAQVAVMSLVIYGANVLTRRGIGEPIERIVEREKHRVECEEKRP